MEKFMARPRLALAEMTPEQVYNREKNERAKQRKEQHAYQTVQKGASGHSALPAQSSGIRANAQVPAHSNLQSADPVSKWEQLFANPIFYAYLAPISTLVSYCGYQGYLFLSLSLTRNDAISSAVIAELVMVICSVYIPMLRGLAKGALLALFLAGGVGVTLYVESCISAHALSAASASHAIEENRTALKSLIADMDRILADTAPEQLAKRNALISRKTTAISDLAQLSKPSSQSSTPLGSGMVWYNVWIRIAAMLCCALLLHRFVRFITCFLNC
jgi:hypothetical protein